MKRIVLAVSLLLSLCLAVCLPAHAATSTYDGSAIHLLSRNTDSVRVVPYSHDCVTTGTGVSSGASSYEVLVFGQQFRIRQHGSVLRVGLYINATTNLTGVFIKFWRPLGSTGGAIWYLKGTSENIISSLTPSQVNYVTLVTPVANIHEGDYYSIRLEGTAIPAGALMAKDVASTNLYSVANATPTATGYSWLTQTATSGKAVPVEMFMQAPHAVSIGDSFTSGMNENRSMLETVAISRPYDTYMAYLRTLTDNQLVYQNMGLGGDTTTMTEARFAADVVNLKPRYAIIAVGTNDITGSVAKAVFLAKWTSMLGLCATNNIKPIVLLMPPRTASSNVQMQTRDDWNASLRTSAEGYGAYIVNLDSYVGQYRAGGDSGNLWDIKALYDGDGSHENPAGYYQWGVAIKPAFVGGTLVY